jgi:hypothetical protein
MGSSSQKGTAQGYQLKKPSVNLQTQQRLALDGCDSVTEEEAESLLISMKAQSKLQQKKPSTSNLNL